MASVDSMENTAQENSPLIRPNVAVQNEKQRKRHFACLTILITEVLERVAFLSMAVTLGIFLNKEPLDWTSYNSIIATFILIGTAYTFSFIGSMIADMLLGRYRTICLFFLIYIAGYIFFPVLDELLDASESNTNYSLPKMCTHRSIMVPRDHLIPTNISLSDQASNYTPISNSTLNLVGGADASRTRSALNENCAWPIYFFVCLMAVGAGAVKANIAPYGAQHWKDEEHPHKDVVQSFFDWFFWCANIGSLVALGIIAFVQQTFNFHAGYIASTISLGVALFFFGTGGGWYKSRIAEASRVTRLALKNCLGVLKFGFCFKASCCWKTDPNRSTVSVLADVSGDFGSLSSLRKPRSWFDYARREQCGGPYSDQEVDDSLAFLKLVVLFSTFVPYWTIYHQMPTAFIFQGLHMDLQTETVGFHIPVAWLYLFEPLVMVFFIPLLDIWVYSKLKQRGRCPHILRNRIAIGFVLSISAVVVAGLVEYERRDGMWSGVATNQTPHVKNQNISNTFYEAAQMNAAWQIPQYLLLGLAEVFASVAGLELAYSQSSIPLKGVTMSLFWLFCGVGSFFGALFSYFFTGIWFFTWDEGNINCRLLCPDDVTKICNVCHLDYYFFFLAGFGFLGLPSPKGSALKMTASHCF
ncbi:solute carrier family 15 member 4-like [Lineus longissimus]|uniref:solute carrier family 15 member 4-like n=1 Tax=Lineus longissimus TaxID=88925 RepID=UPI00315CF9A1